MVCSPAAEPEPRYGCVRFGGNAGATGGLPDALGGPAPATTDCPKRLRSAFRLAGGKPFTVGEAMGVWDLRGGGRAGGRGGAGGCTTFGELVGAELNHSGGFWIRIGACGLEWGVGVESNRGELEGLWRQGMVDRAGSLVWVLFLRFLPLVLWIPVLSSG